MTTEHWMLIAGAVLNLGIFIGFTEARYRNIKGWLKGISQDVSDQRKEHSVTREELAELKGEVRRMNGNTQKLKVQT